jgi:DNA-binding Xre family transcriptional regulator
MKAPLLLKTNIDDLLRKRGSTRKELAQWCYKSESWISKIFREAKREIPLKHLDRIADFFGLSAHQMLQPGISRGSERRSGHDRRIRGERRISQQQRLVMTLDANIAGAHPRRDSLALTPLEERVIAKLRMAPPQFVEHLLALKPFEGVIDADQAAARTPTKRKRSS